MGSMRFGVGAVVVLGLALGGAALAQATETTRAEYVAAVEPICKANTKDNERILSGVRAEVNRGKLKPAARRLMRAAAALQKTLTELRAVPQPAADQPRLAKWLRYVKIEVELLRRIGKKLKAGDEAGALALRQRLDQNANLGNSTVLAFSFRYCRFDPSKFI